MTFTIAQESPDQPEIHALITALDEALDSQYQGFCNYRLDVSALLAPQVRFFVARDAAKKPSVSAQCVFQMAKMRTATNILRK